MEKMVMIPSWRYEKMIESYDNAIRELETLRRQLETTISGQNGSRKG